MSNRNILSVLFILLAFFSMNAGCDDSDVSDSSDVSDLSDDSSDAASDDSVADDDSDDDTSDDATDDASDDSSDDFADDSADDAADDTGDDSDDDEDDDTVPYGYEGWVVGTQGVDEGSETAVVFHDAHGTWSADTLPALSTPNRLNDIAFLSPTDGWAVGGEGDFYTGTGIVLHRDAAAWSKVTLPANTCSDFYKVEFLDADHGWVLCGMPFDENFILEYDTGSWSVLSVPLKSSPSVYFYDFAPLGPGHVFLSGILLGAGGLALFFEIEDGEVVDQLWGSYFDWFHGMQIAGGNDGYLTQCSWRAMFYQQVIYHFDGTSWLSTSEVVGSGCTSEFARSPGGTWYAAGFDYGPSIFTRSGGTWSVIPMVVTKNEKVTFGGFWDIVVPADDFGVAVGGASTVGYEGYGVRFDGSTWHVIHALADPQATYHGVSYVSSPLR